MAKAYLIGGTPRTGKTVLAMHYIKKQPTLAASSDAIRYMLRQIRSKEQQPDLFHFGKYTSNDPTQREYLLTHLQKAIQTQNNESVLVWKSVKDFIMSNIEDGKDVLIEGTAILPELFAGLDCDYEAIFIGNQSS